MLSSPSSSSSSLSLSSSTSMPSCCYSCIKERLPFIWKFGAKFLSNGNGIFWATKNRNGIEFYYLQNTGKFFTFSRLEAWHWQSKQMVQKILVILVKTGKRYYLFSAKFPPGWTVPFEFSPEFPGFPYKW